MNNQLLSLLGLMRRAGKLSLGFDAAADSVASGESCLILTTADISPKTLKELNYKIHETVCVLPLDCSQETLGKAIGKNVKIISVNDRGFAQKAKLLMEAP
ncbi:MAG: ribosomal L7Ae/L30e/S12e/Gadd45 family protein [Clostridia bacterium]|nr:ribosomal L7Ae/L30e/S12e/Gadd45 family protein [Clostridia bacterium]MBQ4396527.1 ribosomal L7Ae/L30e/S12e/Gadd45 family protein [Clostridia bacterium]